jgi:hypothetical protein
MHNGLYKVQAIVPNEIFGRNLGKHGNMNPNFQMGNKISTMAWTQDTP